MKINKIEHIGIAVENLEESIRYYEDILGLKCYATEEVKDQSVKTAFFKVGEVKIELLESTAPDAPIGNFIKNRGQGIHHIAFEVDKVDEALQEVNDKGIRLIDKVSRKGSEGMDIGFLHPKSSFGVLTEFCSK